MTHTRTVTQFSSTDEIEGAIAALTDLLGPPNHDNGNYVCFTHPERQVTVARQEQTLTTQPNPTH